LRRLTHIHEDWQKGTAKGNSESRVLLHHLQLLSASHCQCLCSKQQQQRQQHQQTAKRRARNASDIVHEDKSNRTNEAAHVL
jgi:hypothetical protein